MDAILLLLNVVAMAADDTAVYRIQPADDASTALTVEKTGLLSGKKHLFTFRRYVGTLQFNRQWLERSSVQLSISSASIECQDTWINERDRKKVTDVALNDMLGASQYPEIVFRSTRIQGTGGGPLQVDGELTIRGRTKPVVVKVSVNMGQNDRVIVKGETRIRLTHYGLKPPSAAFGAVGTKEEMLFIFTVIARPE